MSDSNKFKEEKNIKRRKKIKNALKTGDVNNC